MIQFKTGDILAEDVDALVNTVNCVGVMGRGIALQFKKAYPDNFRDYAGACKRGEVQPGRMFVHRTNRLVGPRYVINFPTKRHWRGKSRMDDIESGLKALANAIPSLGISSIALPPLGCGLGGLSWSDVRPRIVQTLEQFRDLRVVLFEPGGRSSDRRANYSTKAPNMTPGRAALVGLMDRYLRGLLDPFITLLEVHKLMYFLQEAGEPLRLGYVKGQYGPYAEKLRHVLRDVEGHLVSGYADVGDRPNKQLSIIPGALKEAQALLIHKKETLARFERVSALVSGFESSFGLELLSTVHWVVAKDGIREPDSVVEATHGWGERKKSFTPRQIRLAQEVLHQQAWL